MKLENSTKFAFVTMGVAALNSALMANGIETMPGMWMKEVYQNPILGASIGGMTGIAVGGVIGAGYVAAQEVVKTSIKTLRDKFKNKPKLDVPALKM